MAININKHGNYFQTNLNKVGIAVSSQGGTRETSKIQLFRALHQSQIGKYEAWVQRIPKGYLISAASPQHRTTLSGLCHAPRLEFVEAG